MTERTPGQEKYVSELDTIAMPRISTQEKYSIETWLGLVGILVQHTR